MYVNIYTNVRKYIPKMHTQAATMFPGVDNILPHACKCEEQQTNVPKFFDTLMACRASRSFA